MSARRQHFAFPLSFRRSRVEWLVIASLLGMCLLTAGNMVIVTIHSSSNARVENSTISEPAFGSFSEPTASEYWGLVR